MWSANMKTLNPIEGVKKPMTNADRIRAMTDDELAVFLDATQHREWEEIQENQQEFYEFRSCVEGWKTWLQQPAEGDA